MNGGTHDDRPNVVYPAETHKKQMRVDIFCPRCGEPLGFKEMPKVGVARNVECFDCGGKCMVYRIHETLYRITYAKEK